MFINTDIKSSRFFLGSIIFLVAFALYYQTVSFDFTFDDTIQVVNNEYVRSADIGVSQILSVFAKPTYPGDLYRPLVLLSFRLNKILLDEAPWHFHLFNIFLYGGISILVFLLVENYFKNKLIGFIAAIFFVLMPVHVEPVANVYGRTELLAAFFGLSCIYSFLEAVRKNSWSLRLLSGLCFFLAIISKESALTLLLLAPLFSYFCLDASLKKIGRPACSLLFWALFYFALRVLILNDRFLVQTPEDGLYYQENPLFYLSLQKRIWPVFYIFGQYLRMILFPGVLSADYSFPEKDIMSIIYSYQGVFYSAVSILGLLIIFFLRHSPKIFFWAIWIPVSFSLTINLIVPIGTFYADRLAFFPSIGVAVLLSLAVRKALEGRNFKFLKISLLAVYLSFLLIKTINRLPVWQDNSRLFEQTIVDNPYSSKAMMARGVNSFKYGNYKIAAESFKEALFRDPSYAIAGKYLVISYFRLKDFARTAYWAKKYLEVEPEDKEIKEIFMILTGQRQNLKENDVSNKLP